MKPFLLDSMKKKLPLLALVIASGCIFALVFALYSLPVEAALYPALLCTALWLLAAAVSLLRDLQRHRAVMEAMKQPPRLMQEHLPQAESPREADDFAVIDALTCALRDEEEKNAAQYSRMTDYYTLWVHQIKTPIASLRLRLESSAAEDAAQMTSDLNRIEQYVTMVMTYLRLESDATDYVFRTVSVDAMLRACIRRSAGEFILRGITLDYRPTEMTALTDEKWLSFVVEQIISNSLKYTPSGGTVTISTGEEGIVIRDTGSGIAPQDLPRVFDRGFTGLNGRTGRASSGLGLYLCKRVCAMLRHGISITSAPGQGTAVTVSLRREAPEND